MVIDLVYSFKELRMGVYRLITCLALFGCMNIAQGGPVQDPFEAAEARLKNSQMSVEEKGPLYVDLAKKYEADFRYQESIWTLKAAGLGTGAREQELHLERVMKQGPYSTVREYNRGDMPVRIRVGENKVYGIFKAGNAAEREILAYQLDKALDLNIVPLTVEVSHPEFGDGSLQYFVRNGIVNPDGGARNVYFSKSGYPEGQGKMWLLDYLIDNKDRNGQNWFRRFGGHTVAIDHGDSMGRFAEKEWQEFDPEIKISMQEGLFPQGELLNRLKQLEPSDFSGLSINLEPLFKRRDQILKRISEIGSTGACGISLGKGTDTLL